MKKSTQRARQRPSNDTQTARTDSVVIQITTTRPIIEMIDAFVKTGFYGNSRAAAGERLIGEGLRAGLKEGMIQKRAKVMEIE